VQTYTHRICFLNKATLFLHDVHSRTSFLLPCFNTEGEGLRRRRDRIQRRIQHLSLISLSHLSYAPFNKKQYHQSNSLLQCRDSLFKKPWTSFELQFTAHDLSSAGRCVWHVAGEREGSVVPPKKPLVEIVGCLQWRGWIPPEMSLASAWRSVWVVRVGVCGRWVLDVREVMCC